MKNGAGGREEQKQSDGSLSALVCKGCRCDAIRFWGHQLCCLRQISRTAVLFILTLCITTLFLLISLASCSLASVVVCWVSNIWAAYYCRLALMIGCSEQRITCFCQVVHACWTAIVLLHEATSVLCMIIFMRVLRGEVGFAGPVGSLGS